MLTTLDFSGLISRQPEPYRLKRSVRVLAGPAENLEIIGVSYDIHFLQIAAAQSAVDVAFYCCTAGVLPDFVFVMSGHILLLRGYPPIELVENNVGQQGRQDAALWRSLCWI